MTLKPYKYIKYKLNFIKYLVLSYQNKKILCKKTKTFFWKTDL